MGRLRPLARGSAAGTVDWMVSAVLDQDGSARGGGSRGVEQPLEQLAVALDRHVLPAPLHEEPVERIHSAFDEDIRVLDRPAPRVAVDEARDFAPDPELERAGRRNGRKDRVERAVQPAEGEVILLGRRIDRAKTPERERADDRLELAAVGGQLVDLRRRRRVQTPFRLQLLEPRREDVRADAGQAGSEVGVALRALEQLPDDEERPALPNLAEGVGDGAVLVVALAHGSSVARTLAVVKIKLAKSKRLLVGCK